jgi:hypothetical protein
VTEAPRADGDRAPPAGAEIAEPPALAPAGAVLPLPSGRRIEAISGADGDLIRVRARSGECVLTVRVTDEGPVLRFSGAAIELAAGAIDLSCERLRVRSAGEIAMEAGAGVAIRANDDVALDGERVLLNSADPPMPLTLEEHRARQRARAALAPAPGGEPEPAPGGEPEPAPGGEPEPAPGGGPEGAR